MTLKIPPEMDARLNAEARSRRVSKSQIAREMIEDGLKKTPARRVSLHDRLKQEKQSKSKEDAVRSESIMRP